MSTIHINEEFKDIIKTCIKHSDTLKVNYILRDLIEGGYIDDEFGHLIFPHDENVDSSYDAEMDAIVLDAIEDEIKLQLLEKLNTEE